MTELVLFGAGRVGKDVAELLNNNGYLIVAIVDNSNELYGESINGAPIISLDKYMESYAQYDIVIAVNERILSHIKKQLLDNGIKNFSYYKEIQLTDTRERLISYSGETELEDVILYHVLKGYEDIFYIDIGSNDPFLWSVTKLLYDMKGAHGINIEPQQNLIDITNRERVRDINICAGVGSERGEMELYIQGGIEGAISTMVQAHVVEGAKKVEKVQIYTLESICEQYLQPEQEITFLKIDVEGAEKAVLEGADFTKYRPWIIVMESTLPCTSIPCYEQWEYILQDNHYHYVFSYGVNRYYVADEKNELDCLFAEMKEPSKVYKIYQAKMMP